MDNDEQKIRELIAEWLRATAIGDLPKVLTLMAEDVVFLLPGQPPMRGREAFAAGLRTALQNYRIEGTSNIQEIQISGDWGYCWNHLSVSMMPLQGGPARRRVGYTLSIFRKRPDGNWVLARDANLVTAEA